MNKTILVVSLLIALLPAREVLGQTIQKPALQLVKQAESLKKLHSGVADLAVRQQLISGLDKLIAGYLELPVVPTTQTTSLPRRRDQN